MPVGWDEAFRLIAEKLRAPDPNEAVFYTSGRTSNEAAFVYQLFVRGSAPTTCPTAPTCATSPAARRWRDLGIGKGTVSLDDHYKADLIIVVGQNPGTNHPRMLTALEKAKSDGATIVAVNPLPEAGLLRYKNPQKAGASAAAQAGRPVPADPARRRPGAVRA